MSVPDLGPMNDEAEAWQVVVAEWRRLFPTVDMNDAGSDRFVRAVELWGEYLVALRSTQPPTGVAIARADKLGAYVHACEQRP